jgi:hypothetical protein
LLLENEAAKLAASAQDRANHIRHHAHRDA